MSLHPFLHLSFRSPRLSQGQDGRPELRDGLVTLA